MADAPKWRMGAEVRCRDEVRKLTFFFTASCVQGAGGRPRRCRAAGTARQHWLACAYRKPLSLLSCVARIVWADSA
jgi:hypothetical protein